MQPVAYAIARMAGQIISPAFGEKRVPPRVVGLDCRFDDRQTD
jgi:hypothetical protein